MTSQDRRFKTALDLMADEVKPAQQLIQRLEQGSAETQHFVQDRITKITDHEIAMDITENRQRWAAIAVTFLLPTFGFAIALILGLNGYEWASSIIGGGDIFAISAVLWPGVNRQEQ